MVDAIRRIRDNDFSDAPASILHAIEQAPLVSEELIGDTRSVARHALSPREVQILSAVSHGMTNEMIGETYGIHVDTVKTHMRRILVKLAAKNRAHAVAVALRRRLIS